MVLALQTTSVSSLRGRLQVHAIGRCVVWDPRELQAKVSNPLPSSAGAEMPRHDTLHRGASAQSDMPKLPYLVLQPLTSSLLIDLPCEKGTKPRLATISTIRSHSCYIAEDGFRAYLYPDRFDAMPPAWACPVPTASPSRSNAGSRRRSARRLIAHLPRPKTRTGKGCMASRLLVNLVLKSS